MKRGASAAIAALSVLIVLACACSTIAGERVGIGPLPAWVTRLPNVLRPLTEEERNQPFVILLKDLQIANVGGKSQEYVRQVIALNTRVTVERFSGLHILFDPERQTATLHRIAIFRDGKLIDVTNRAQLRTQRVASNLDSQRRANQILVSYVIPDLRAGDIVDMAVTLDGDIAGLPGRFLTEIEEKFGEAKIALLHRRVVVTPKRPIHLDLVAGHPPPIDRSRPDRLVWEWTIHDYKQPKTFSDAPAWFPQIPAIRISDFRDWAEVVAWGRELLRPKRRPSRPIRKLARRIAGTATTPWEKLTAVLRHVQNNIRYLGDGLLARNGYIPLRPEDVASQGVGDCKDKVALAIALLAALDIEAWPVLTNATKGRVPRAIPTPLAFDHALLAVRLGDHDIWVDPTLRPLPDGNPNFGLPAIDAGLVLRKGERDLVSPAGLPVASDGTLLATGDPPLPGPRPDSDFETEIERRLDLTTAQAELHSVFKGGTAQIMRMAIEMGAREKLEETFLALIRSWLWGLDPADTFVLEGDPHHLRYDARLRAELTDELWKKDGAQEYLRLLPDYILQLMARMAVDEDRPETVPVAFGSGRPRILERYVIKTPPGWKLKSLHRTLRRDGYIISVNTGKRDGDFAVTYRFRALRDHLMPAQVRQMAEDRKLLKGEWSYWLWRPARRRRAADSP